MLLNILPQLRILLDLNFSARIELVEASEIHVLLQKRDDIGIEGLPVGVLEMIPILFSEKREQFDLLQRNTIPINLRAYGLGNGHVLLTALVRISFDDRECSRVFVVLHDEPGKINDWYLPLIFSRFKMTINFSYVPTHQPRHSLSLLYT
jgi:hypothetical protein